MSESVRASEREIESERVPGVCRTPVRVPSSSSLLLSSLEMSDTHVYEPYIRACAGLEPGYGSGCRV